MRLHFFQDCPSAPVPFTRWSVIARQRLKVFLVSKPIVKVSKKFAWGSALLFCSINWCRPYVGYSPIVLQVVPSFQFSPGKPRKTSIINYEHLSTRNTHHTKLVDVTHKKLKIQLTELKNFQNTSTQSISKKNPALKSQSKSALNSAVSKAWRFSALIQRTWKTSALISSVSQLISSDFLWIRAAQNCKFQHCSKWNQLWISADSALIYSELVLILTLVDGNIQWY